ncbi:DUF1285 domain-containing protein [Thalassotalea litorea]|uniref:DUF1285 domain-containing protein n=1 Tax=Thalassotalea litorea TaxID=2020715 RepID=UPI003736FCF5
MLSSYMSLEKLVNALNTASGEGPPIEKWNPPFCGDIAINIDRQGKWFYQNSEIGRAPMVQLFATVLWFEDSEYFLVTPVEKVRITVDDLPLIITQWQHINDTSTPLIQVSTSVGDSVIISEQHPIEIDEQGLKVRIRRNLYARVHRNVYYQWAEMADIKTDNDAAHQQKAVICSAGKEYSIGNL